MAISAELQIAQKQKLVMNQQMRQALEVLRMPLAELQDYLTEAASENPLLELEYPRGEERPEPLFPQDAEEIRWSAAYGQGAAPHGQGAAAAEDPFAAMISEETFTEMLCRQITEEAALPPELCQHCLYIVQSLNPRGYLPQTAAELAEELGISVFDAEQAIYAVQSLSPTGVGARDLQECLVLQLVESSDFNEYTLKIIREGLELLGSNQYARLAKLLGLPQAETLRWCDAVRRLNPIPSRGYPSGGGSQYVIPEAEVLKENGSLVIRYYEEALPKLVVQQEYCRLIQTVGDDATREYLKKNRGKAQELLDQLHQRTDTILRILREVVAWQRNYFETGAAALEPMTITDLAEALELSPSTVSRAVSGKYIVCKNGTVALRSLFTAKLAGFGEAAVSAGAVKERLRQLIGSENKQKPLSDEALRQRIEALGTPISRRTVAKYREELGIPAAFARKVPKAK